MNRKKLFKRCIKKFGRNLQLFVIMEELSELIKAISKFERGISEDNRDITEELADVYIVLEYVELIYGIDKIELKEMKKQKEARLKKRINLT